MLEMDVKAKVLGAKQHCFTQNACMYARPAAAYCACRELIR